MPRPKPKRLIPSYLKIMRQKTGKGCLVYPASTTQPYLRPRASPPSSLPSLTLTKTASLTFSSSVWAQTIRSPFTCFIIMSTTTISSSRRWCLTLNKKSQTTSTATIQLGLATGSWSLTWKTKSLLSSAPKTTSKLTKASSCLTVSLASAAQTTMLRHSSQAHR